MYNTGAGQTPKLYAKDCKFLYGQSGVAGCLTVNGVAEVYLQGCEAAFGGQDGFNYHVLNSVVPKVVEIDCVGRSNGTANGDDNDNGSSIHENGDICRINGEYYGNLGPNVVDIDGAQSGTWASCPRQALGVQKNVLLLGRRACGWTAAGRTGT